MAKIKRKTMNRIHNEMVRRFTPYWERKTADINQAQRAIVELQRAVKDLSEQVTALQGAAEPEADKGKHVAEPEKTEIPELAPIWEARFSVYGSSRPIQIPGRYTYALKNLGIRFDLYAGAKSASYVSVLLQPTRYNAAVPLLEEQLRRLLSAPVKVTWRKVQ